MTSGQSEASPQLRQANQLIGIEIFDASGRVGRIVDVMLRPSGELAYAIVQTPEGTKYYPVPWSQLYFPASDMRQKDGVIGERVMIAFERERLQTAPGFELTEWPKPEDRSVFDESSRFFGETPEGPPREPATTAPSSAFLRASQLPRQGITDARGAPIGALDQIIFDPALGRVSYATVHLRDRQGAELRTIAMPWDVLQTTREAGVDRFQVGVPSDRLQAAPLFRGAATDWQAMSSRRYLDDLYKHYSVPPYWTNRASPVPASARTDPNSK